MGSATFSNYQAGERVDVAFGEARESAVYEYGHRGYSGTIAEKGAYTIITHEVLTLEAAQALADRLIEERDPRVDDKWGPAGAIPVKTPTREVTVTGLAGQLGDTEGIRESALALLRKQRKTRRGEKVAGVNLRSYLQGRSTRFTTSSSPRFTQGTAVVTLTKGPKAYREQATADGWLFFGWASY